MLSGSPLSLSKSRSEWLWKRWPAAPVQPDVEGLAFESAAPAVVLGQDFLLARGEHAVEPSEHGHGQHDALVLRRAVGTAQQVGDLPDQVGEVVVVGHFITFRGMPRRGRRRRTGDTGNLRNPPNGAPTGPNPTRSAPRSESPRRPPHGAGLRPSRRGSAGRASARIPAAC